MRGRRIIGIGGSDRDILINHEGQAGGVELMEPLPSTSRVHLQNFGNSSLQDDEEEHAF